MPGENDRSFKSGMRAFRDKQYHEAVLHFTHVIREKSDIHKSFNALGVTYSKIGNTKEAELCFEKALLLDPHNPTYEKNLGTLHVKKKTGQDPGTISPRRNAKKLLMIGILLIGVAALIFFGLISLVYIQSGGSMPWDGTGGGGLIQPLLDSLAGEEYIIPTASVAIHNKKIDYMFDRHQDLSKIKRIEATVSIPDGTQADFPVVTNPQNNLYYGIDDPFFGKEKRFIVTGFLQDDTTVVLTDTTLPPR